MKHHRYVRLSFGFLLAGLLGHLAPPQAIGQPRLVRNINQTDVGNGSNPVFFPVGEAAVFLASSGTGLALWRTDGTAVGTAELVPETFSSAEAGLLVAAVGDRVAFFGHRDAPGLWQTDGDPLGTIELLSDDRVAALELLPGEKLLLVTTDEGGSYVLRVFDPATGLFATLIRLPTAAPQGLVDFAFTRFGARALLVEAGSRLWVSDGTPEGTERLLTGGVGQPVVAGDVGVLLRRVSDGRLEVWRTDGTAAGTRAVGVVAPDRAFVSALTRPVAIGQRVVLMTETEGGLELWSTDLATGTVRRLLGVDGPTFYTRNSLQALGGRALFVASTGAAGLEPWITDGTPAGTRRLADLCPGECSSVPTLGQPAGVARLGGSLVFAALDGSGLALWQVAAASGSPVRFADVCSDCSNSRDIALAPFGSERVLWEWAEELFLGEGEGAAPVPLAASVNGGGPGFTGATLVGERLLLALHDDRGTEPWTSDGTRAGTGILLDIVRDDAGSNPSRPLVMEDELVFFADDGVDGRRLWRSDGSEEGTRPLGFADEDDPWAQALDRRRVGDRLFLLSATRDGHAVWVADSLDAAPRRLTPFFTPPSIYPPGPPPVTIADAVDLGGSLVFRSELGIYHSDGTVAGTVVVTPAELPVSSTLQAAGERALFESAATVQGEGRVLWATDGSVEGTGPVLTAEGEPLDSILGVGLSMERGIVFLRQPKADGLFEIWESDGTPSGSRRLVSHARRPDPLAVSRSAVFYQLFSDDGSIELFAASADTAPVRLRRVPRGAYTPVPILLASGAAGTLFFHESNGVEGRIVASDGTRAGTARVAGVPPNVVGFVLNEELYYFDGNLKRVTGEGTIHTLARGVEPMTFEDVERAGEHLILPLRDRDLNENLWRVGGTPAGTFPITDFPPDPLSARVAMPTLVRDRLFFSAYRRMIGQELWLLDATDLGSRVLALSADGRFNVRVRFVLPNGESASGSPVQLTSDTGYFFFIDPENVELVVKILDGRRINGHFWLFYGSLSNLEYEITVTDTQSGRVEIYENEAGEFGSFGDITPFPDPGGAALTPAPTNAFLERDPLSLVEERAKPPTARRSCAGSFAALCLQGSRFTVELEWEAADGTRRSGKAWPLSADTGYFTFLDDANVEVVAKVLDGRGVNGHFWVFYGALSNLGYRLIVTDTLTGEVEVYDNPAGRFASRGDDRAFADPR